MIEHRSPKSEDVDLNSTAPAICTQCGKELTRKYQKKFCSRSCSAQYNNKGVRRHGQSTFCKICQTKLPKGRYSYCSNTCKLTADTQNQSEFIRRWLSGEFSGLDSGSSTKLNGRIRKHLLTQAQFKCSLCGWGERNVHTNTIPLHIDHIDGDYRNCSNTNLRVLCPNCHSLTSTYGGANRGNGRPFFVTKRKS